MGVDTTTNTNSVLVVSKDGDDIEKVKEWLGDIEGVVFEYYETPPGERELNYYDEMLKQHEKILLVITLASLRDEVMKYCRSVIPENKTTLVLIPDDSVVPYLDLGLKRLTWVQPSEEGWKEKLHAAITTVPENRVFRLPVAPIYPGLVFNFFSGFLQFVLPTFEECLKTWEAGEGVGTKEDGPLVTKMLILVPRSCICKDRVEQYDEQRIVPYDGDDGKVVCAENPLVPKPHRSYDQRVYKVSGGVGAEDQSYRVVPVLCATVHALGEMLNDPNTPGDSQAYLDAERKPFVNMLRRVLDKPVYRDRAIVREFDDKPYNNLADVIFQACKEVDPN